MNGRVPFADLLSTFTGAWTLRQLEALDRLDRGRLARFVASAERSGGGYHAWLGDAGHDVEYTFYGLGVTALTVLE